MIVADAVSHRRRDEAHQLCAINYRRKERRLGPANLAGRQPCGHLLLMTPLQLEEVVNGERVGPIINQLVVDLTQENQVAVRVTLIGGVINIERGPPAL